MTRETIEKIYAGFLGMDAGMLIGAPIENPYWTYERIRDYFGDMQRYPREYKHYAADDDINGPVIFLRALTDGRIKKGFTAEAAGETWLNYTRCGRGMFWWGGEDLSTEHRAYMNLKRGEKAPRSGSIDLNGRTAAEQIGGEIFIDTWGLICPGEPEKAAAYARTAASVSHDGEGLNGAAFIAGCIAAAFTAESIDEIIDAGLRQLPPECEYRTAVDTVRAFHGLHPENFRACRDYIAERFSERDYPGYCHIIPNGAVCVLALLYGGGELGRTIEISCMCGFDTDCNASNVGTILGVYRGLAGIPERYRRPINDSAVLSCASGYLNMLDIPGFAKELAAVASALRGEKLPEDIRLPRPGELLFDFTLPGATHGIRLSDYASHELRTRTDMGYASPGYLEMQIDGKVPPPADMSFKACFRREDFNEERYDPVFSPRVYPGQTVRCFMKSVQLAPAVITVTPYLTTSAGERLDFAPVVLPEGEWQEVAFAVPELHGVQAHDVGWNVAIEPVTKPWTHGKVLLDEITVTGPMDYTIDPARQNMEFGDVTPFSTNDGVTALESGALRFTSERDAQSFTGNYYTADGTVEADVTVVSGGGMLLLRAQGTRRYYALGFEREGHISIFRFDGGEKDELAGADFPWQAGETYHLRAKARGDKLSLSVNGEKLLKARDERFTYGMTGIAHADRAESLWKSFHITGEC